MLCREAESSRSNLKAMVGGGGILTKAILAHEHDEDLLNNKEDLMAVPELRCSSNEGASSSSSFSTSHSGSSTATSIE
ncbi:unnamed protein product [Litomosoides sigmodontis]|uniref:Uncharacterized protein n=1 Tax=Litomosoides sigmodontis TaxID=42156 RepID=A0A3P6SMT8_LITSI|nr:unnamed protein product [Litomosoides sigmodontis]